LEGGGGGCVGGPRMEPARHEADFDEYPPQGGWATSKKLILRRLFAIHSITTRPWFLNILAFWLEFDLPSPAAELIVVRSPLVRPRLVPACGIKRTSEERTTPVQPPTPSIDGSPLIE